jgi:mRNA interferase HicA
VKRRALLKRIAAAAAEADIDFGLVREGAEHSVYQCGSERFTVPRHAEINEITAVSIMRHLESHLRRGWWR